MGFMSSESWRASPDALRVRCAGVVLAQVPVGVNNSRREGGYGGWVPGEDDMRSMDALPPGYWRKPVSHFLPPSRKGIGPKGYFGSLFD